jgi:hypothetical protein
MQIIRDPATGVADPELRTLISRVFAFVSDCPEILGFIMVVEPGDTLAMLEPQLGVSILDGRHEFIQEHDHWFELVFVTGQDGYGFEVFLPKSEGIDSDLLLMCQRYASPGSV